MFIIRAKFCFSAAMSTQNNPAERCNLTLKAGSTGLVADVLNVNSVKNLACKICVMQVPLHLFALFLGGRDAWDNLTRLDLSPWPSLSVTGL